MAVSNKKLRTLLLATYLIASMLSLFGQKSEHQLQATDSVQPKSNFLEKIQDLNFIIVPTASYTPETNWAFGAAGAYYFNCKNQAKKSDLGFYGSYSLNRQWDINAFSTIYFGGETKWFLFVRSVFRHNVDFFYGIGNRRENLFKERVQFSSENIDIALQPQFYVSDHWSVGPNLKILWTRATAGAKTDSLQQICPTTGLNSPFFMLGLGVVATYDSRNQQFYPSRGIFFKTSLLYYEPYLGSSFRLGNIAAEFRHFVPIYKEFVFAWQAVTEWTFGKEKPFQLLPTLGGTDVVRGIRSGVWRGDAMVALQTEFRIPIWKPIKAAVFAGIGDVYNLDNWQWSTPKIGYGAGLRLAFNKSKVNIRFDVARQNLDNNWSFYLTVKEAF